MNYRHRFHAGNFADVFKHVLLVALLRRLQRKEPGLLYLDTHAGPGRYDLALAARGDTLARKPEHPDGIGRLWSQAGLPLLLADWVDLVRRWNGEPAASASEPQYYPGSPWLARLLARPQDRLAFCELHPEDSAALAAEFAGAPRVRVHAMDGYTALKAMLPPLERRALVLIDPSYESTEEGAHLLAGLGAALRRFPSGVFALWYPLTERARADALLAQLGTLPLPPTLVAELAVAGEQSGLKMRGCGLVVLNPPWQFADEIAPLLPVMAELLQQASGAAGRIEWLVAER